MNTKHTEITLGSPPMSESHNHPNYYSIIPASVRYCADLSAQEKILYSELTALSNVKGYCWATNNYFANLYKLSKETVSRQISKLASLGFIHIKMIYFEHTKQIIERRIYIATPGNNVLADRYATTNNSDDAPIDVIVNTPIDVQNPIDENINTPTDVFVNRGIDENRKDNTTSMNNININTSCCDNFQSVMSCHVASPLLEDNCQYLESDMTDMTDVDILSQNRVTNIYESTMESQPDPVVNAFDDTFYQALTAKMQEQIEIDLFNPNERRVVNDLINNMVDFITTTAPIYITIGNETQHRSKVSDIFLKLTHEHIRLAIEKLREYNKPITNKKNFMRTVLYNAYSELEIHYENQYTMNV